MTALIFFAISLNVNAQPFEKSFLGTNILVPSMGNGLAPVCEGNKQVFQYFVKIMAKPGLSDVLTCFFVEGIGNSKFEHASIILSLNEYGEKDIDKELFLKIKNGVISNVKNRPGRIIAESRDASAKQGLPVSNNNIAIPEIEILKNEDSYAIFRYDTRVPLKSAGREVEKTNILAIVRLKNRVISVTSYAYEIDHATKIKISKDLELWIQELRRINS